MPTKCDHCRESEEIAHVCESCGKQFCAPCVKTANQDKGRYLNHTCPRCDGVLKDADKS